MGRLLIILFVLFSSLCKPIHAALIDTYIEYYQEQLFYPEITQRLYSDDTLKWKSPLARKYLENQLALLALAQLNDSVTARYYQLQDMDGVEYDVLATDTLIYLRTYQSSVSTKGKKWFFGGRIEASLPKPQPETIKGIIKAIDERDLVSFTHALRPSSDQYEELYLRLFNYYQPYEDSESVFIKERLIRPNQITDVKTIIYRLQVSGEINHQEADMLLRQSNGHYDSSLVLIIKEFQKRHGLKQDGIIGPKTLHWLNMTAKERVRIMALNIQRLRLWENKNSHFVLVNIPSYEMAYWQEGELVFTSKVIVGKPERRTPIFTTRLNAIVFNPEWKVPTKIMREDILPKALDNKDFLQSQNFEIIPTWLSKDVISIDDIDWEQVSAETFPYKLKQKSGNTNALGRYKFNTPNRNAIYLHDTPSRSLFSKQHRAYSSGCIRVEKASEFAQLLMKESHFSTQDYMDYHELPETSKVALDQQISVYTIYQTSWVGEDNQVQFRNDIYKYDEWSKSRN
ncbi:L,D-transpeptidase family protein [Aliivibrio fischeri]|uniref:L,D-transpeptidase family protein n=1 Tax=Aliivibrio fischeri TaxID=668 RepID=UPI00080EC8C0|nr:L,D-transpeptidase family protein [Aliivibrio fischeri]OCH01961.1 carboxypeptidase [Aliivibrio fischeri]